MLKPALFDRLTGQESTEQPRARQEAQVRRETLSQLLGSIASNEQVSPQLKRTQVNEHLRHLGESLGEEGAGEAYGHMVLDKLEQTLRPERIDPLRQEFENVRADITPPERERSMERAMAGFVLPRTTQDVENIRTDHPYFYIADGTMLIRTDIVSRDLETLSGPPPLPGKAGEVMAQCRQILQELVDADPANATRFGASRRHRERDPAVQRAVNSARMLFGLFCVAMAALCFAIERKKNFPTMAAIYAGLAVLVLNPKLFSGPLRSLRGQLDFVQSAEWDTLLKDGANRAALTGDRGEDFFRRMTQNGETRMLYSKVRQSEKDKGKKGKISSEEYYQQLAELGVPEQHIAFLRDLEQRNHSQWNFLLYNLMRVQSTDGQDLLAGFAREGMDVDALGKLPTKLPPAAPEAYTGATGVRERLGGFGQKTQDLG